MSYLSGGVTGTIATGLGHHGDAGGAAPDTVYTAKISPGQSFSVSPACSPSLSLTSIASSGISGGSLKYTAIAYPVTLSLLGTILDSLGHQSILVGQGCTASLNTPPFSTAQQSNWNWSVDGNTFQNWNASASSASLSPGLGVTTNSTAHWYWSDITGYYNVNCTATVTPPAGQGLPFQVSATQKVHLYVPQTTEAITVGRVQINNIDQVDYGTDFALYAGGNGNQNYGIILTTKVNTPPLFSPGIWDIVQLDTPGTWTTQLGQSEQPSPVNGMQGLDNRYPFYPSSTPPYITGIPANNLLAQPYDSPGLAHLSNNIIRYRVSDIYASYVMFLPPGSDTQWVPVWLIGWYWNADDSIPGAYWALWNNANDAGIVRASISASTTTHPLWNMLLH